MKRLGGMLLTALCAAALLAVVAFVLLPGLLGLQRFVITGGSMTGTIPKGAVIYSKVVPAAQLKVGDVITFTPPGFTEAVTHRIIGTEAGPDGKTAFRTKGDFNEAADPWNPVTLNEPQQARYVFQVPLLGYVLAALGTRSARIALIAVPAFLIALSILWSLWREAGEELAGELDGAGQAPASHKPARRTTASRTTPEPGVDPGAGAFVPRRAPSSHFSRTSSRHPRPYFLIRSGNRRARCLCQAALRAAARAGDAARRKRWTQFGRGAGPGGPSRVPADAACPVPPSPLASTGSAARAGCTCPISRGETGPGAHLAGPPVSIRPVRAAATTG